MPCHTKKVRKNKQRAAGKPLGCSSARPCSLAQATITKDAKGKTVYPMDYFEKLDAIIDPSELKDSLKALNGTEIKIDEYTDISNEGAWCTFCSARPGILIIWLGKKHINPSVLNGTCPEILAWPLDVQLILAFADKGEGIYTIFYGGFPHQMTQSSTPI